MGTNDLTRKKHHLLLITIVKTNNVCHIKRTHDDVTIWNIWTPFCYFNQKNDDFDFHGQHECMILFIKQSNKSCTYFLFNTTILLLQCRSSCSSIACQSFFQGAVKWKVDPREIFFFVPANQFKFISPLNFYELNTFYQTHVLLVSIEFNGQPLSPKSCDLFHKNGDSMNV